MATDAELTLIESTLLAACEADIRAGLDHFMAVGNALIKIREKNLYRAEYATFEDYCLQRWKMSRGYAYRIISAAEAVEDLSPIGDIKPANEAQARPLTSLPAEERAEAWQEVIDTAPKDDEGEPIITGKHVERTIEKRKPKAEPEPQAEEPAEEPRHDTTDDEADFIEWRDRVLNKHDMTPDRIRFSELAVMMIRQVRKLEGRQAN